MGENKRITVFDCTLREVGYQTGWFYDTEFVQDLYIFAQGKGIDFIELGFFHNAESDPGRGIFRYCSDRQEEIADLFGSIKNRVKISAMRDIQRPLSELKPKNASAVDTIRVLTRSHETDFAVLRRQVSEIRNLGYEVYINFTSAGYNEPEKNAEFADFAVSEQVPMVYFADTESIMTPDYVTRAIDICHAKGLKVGMHFHDKNGTADDLAVIAIRSGVDGCDYTLMGLGGKWLDGNLTVENYLHSFGYSGGYELTRLKNELIKQLIKYNKHSAAG
ncbi:MAG: pyruvate carboxyltransferase [Oscillospiraceae bacterium]|jgi:4-hydroxy 2-oxovalerate aldolase|nr:pyruvate carboxyltransferase [Oscillospiraceae bacterium]